MSEIRRLEQVSVDQIRTDGGTQLRVETDPAVVAAYGERMSDGVEFPGVSVVRDTAGALWLWDGFHRLAAARSIGRTHIYAEVKPGTLDDARLWACQANASHGLQRSQQTKRNQVRAALTNPLTTGWSNGRIAAWCQVSAPFVAGIRSAMDLTPNEVVGRNGKTYRVAEKVTEAHVWASPSLAQVEEWSRSAADKNVREAAARMTTLLRDIERSDGSGWWSWDHRFAGAAKKGSGAIVALALRFEARAAAGTPPEDWHERLECATAEDRTEAVWQLAREPGIDLAHRRAAIRAACQMTSISDWKRESCETEALRARWDAAHAPEPKVQPRSAHPTTVDDVAQMNAEGLHDLTRRWVPDSIFDAVIARAREVAPDLVVVCPDPLCRDAAFLTGWRCRNCHRHPAEAVQSMVYEAQRVDHRRQLQGDPLALLLEMLQHDRDPADDDLFSLRVAVWRAAGCPGLVREPYQDCEALDGEE